YKKHKNQGLLVVGFPSNDFKQELGEDKAIGDFCKATYGVNFPMTPKSSVSGANANPFYKQLTAKSGQAPMWNFYKYVIVPGGKQVYAFESTVLPESADILGKIKPYLK
ncbi:MAG: glutathione peroxidase, partial [Methylotenera sp.]